MTPDRSFAGYRLHRELTPLVGGVEARWARNLRCVPAASAAQRSTESGSGRAFAVGRRRRRPRRSCGRARGTSRRCGAAARAGGCPGLAVAGWPSAPSRARGRRRWSRVRALCVAPAPSPCPPPRGRRQSPLREDLREELEEGHAVHPSEGGEDGGHEVAVHRLAAGAVLLVLLLFAELEDGPQT